MNKISANLFYVREDGLLFVQLKKNHLREHPDLESYFGKTVVQFPSMKLTASVSLRLVSFSMTGRLLRLYLLVSRRLSSSPMNLDERRTLMTREELCRDVFKRAFYHAQNI